MRIIPKVKLENEFSTNLSPLSRKLLGVNLVWVFWVFSQDT